MSYLLLILLLFLGQYYTHDAESTSDTAVYIDAESIAPSLDKTDTSTSEKRDDFSLDANELRAQIKSIQNQIKPRGGKIRHCPKATK